MATMMVVAFAVLLVGDPAVVAMDVARSGSSETGLALIQMNAGHVSSIPQHCRHVSDRLTLHMKDFESLGQHSSIDQCFWEAAKSSECRNHAQLSGNSFMLIYEGMDCFCKTSHSSSVGIVRKNTYLCDFPYPEQECSTVSRYERFVPEKNSSYLKLPNAMDFQECMWMAMASEQCNKQAELANGVYSTLFGVDYCYCAVADDTPRMVRDLKEVGGQSYLCTAIPDLSQARSLVRFTTVAPTNTTLKLPSDRFTDLLEQGGIVIRAQGGPKEHTKLNYMFAVAVKIQGRGEVILEQAHGQRDVKHPLMTLTVNNITNFVRKNMTTMFDALLVNSTRHKVTFYHKPSGLEFVVSSRKTKMKNVTNSHHLNLRINKGIVMLGADKAKGALPQLWGIQPLSSEVRTFIRRPRHRPRHLHHGPGIDN
eukprot:TRINITY_DN20093_c0_g4_i1.p1 TRINITY_DN20093_c0_g4~~TRINITY_DN20093_c0_g4_i1.p1  ORF type:complete len:423 (+),score=41.94 TRINITY_DN20093_c0_g4_i1:85-1353(+)